ncbi:MAG: hypothetical protein NC218_01940 [Acetobacter sp.]|nr:hypothetical protein [Acetobacter sp.]
MTAQEINSASQYFDAFDKGVKEFNALPDAQKSTVEYYISVRDDDDHEIFCTASRKTLAEVGKDGGCCYDEVYVHCVLVAQYMENGCYCGVDIAHVGQW